MRRTNTNKVQGLPIGGAEASARERALTRLSEPVGSSGTGVPGTSPAPGLRSAVETPQKSGTALFIREIISSKVLVHFDAPVVRTRYFASREGGGKMPRIELLMRGGLAMGFALVLASNTES
jgi:hypothetical protein